MRNHENLDVLNKAHELVLKIYRETEHFPEREIYSLTDQIRRAATSIPSNIAEGCGKDSNKDFKRYLETARGSASELDYQIHLACDLNYLDEDTSNTLRTETKELKRMLTGFIDSL